MGHSESKRISGAAELLAYHSRSISSPDYCVSVDGRHRSSVSESQVNRFIAFFLHITQSTRREISEFQNAETCDFSRSRYWWNDTVRGALGKCIPEKVPSIKMIAGYISALFFPLDSQQKIMVVSHSGEIVGKSPCRERVAAIFSRPPPVSTATIRPRLPSCPASAGVPSSRTGA